MRLFFKSLLGIFCFWCSTPVSAQAPNNAEDISPLLIGETIPSATLQDSDGNLTQLKRLIKKKPTILVFYRGGWCPYCNMQLSGLVDIENDILDLGYQIVAISPDDYKNLKSTKSNDSINYTLLSDPNAKFIQQVGIGFKTPTMLKGFIAAKRQKGDTSEVMPVPTVMVLDKEGKILFEYINPNYKERIGGEMLLAVLKTIKN
ncbi:AhpC/TSA family protein [Winogradskyella sp. F6397]|uniref:thioredoxin-dependent peroxiredoxin n=1 Tax=Winogradskyella marina TaxID=2785530 RepID=A0ABS0EGQ5_9FLAO|nr:peroxiredoxin-like family protein [Winogradskyella marina]MBF8149631.1 AhpC/TSA family protein [Winogradskyella marina]